MTQKDATPKDEDEEKVFRWHPDRARLHWAGSKTIGGVSEIAVMAPIRRGCPAGERRTYEEILRATIANLARRHEQGLPTELDKISTIHFGRMIILRPEQYLSYSDGVDMSYYRWTSRRVEKGDRPIPVQLEDYKDDIEPSDTVRGLNTRLPSWLLTLVEFDGDLKVYMRNIAKTLNRDFDAIFRNCEDYPETRSFEIWWQWIRRFQIPTDLFYATYPNLSVARLKQLEAFKRRFDAFVARVRSPTGGRAASMDELFDEFLRENQQYARGFPTPGGLYPPTGHEEER